MLGNLEVAFNSRCNGKDRRLAANKFFKEQARAAKSSPRSLEELVFIEALNGPF